MWRRIPQTSFSLHAVTDGDVVDNSRAPLGSFDIPGAIIIESCTALCATTLLSMAQNSDAVHRTSPLVESTEAP